MSRESILITAVLAVIAVSCLVLLPGADSESLDEAMDESGTVVISPVPLTDESTASEVVAYFELISERIKHHEANGEKVKVFLDKPTSPPMDPKLIEHMMDSIGREYFFGEMPPEGEPKGLPPDDRFPKKDFKDLDTIPPVEEEDLGTNDPEFVKDVIVFAVDNGMEDIASELSDTLSKNMLAFLRTVNSISSADTRADGIESVEEDQDIELIEDPEEDPEIPEVYPDVRAFFTPIAEAIDSDSCVILEL